MVQTGSLAILTVPRALGDGKPESDFWEKARKGNFGDQLSLDPKVGRDLITKGLLCELFASLTTSYIFLLQVPVLRDMWKRMVVPVVTPPLYIADCRVCIPQSSERHVYPQ